MSKSSSFSTIRSMGLLALFCALMVLFSGCSSRQANFDDPSLPFVCDAGDLTAQERAALAQNKGRIARSVPESAQPLIEKQAAFFLHTGRRNMEVHVSNAAKHLPYTRQIFRSRGLPEELAYLAIVESGYRISARSRVGAAGAWQFMPPTGRMYGLRQDSYSDERMDIYKSTVAAAEYLKKLHGQFGDWPTAIAAYNAGEGKMTRACQATGERTFFGVLKKNDRLDEKTQLREETRQYVPRFLAVCAIMENLPALGFQPVNPDAAPRMIPVELAPGTNLKALASASDISWTEFKESNPHFLQEISHKSLATTAYVPASRGAKAIALASSPKARQTAVAAKTAKTETATAVAAGGKYTMRSGDTLTSVARRHNTTVTQLMAKNNIANANSVRIGQVLRIPGAKTAQAKAAAPAQTKAAKAGKAVQTAYRVQPNDTLWQISRQLNVSVADLKRWNNLEGEGLQTGQTLVVMR